MRVLITGATSFTGMHFVQSLAARGHSLVATLRAPRASYDGLRAARLEQISGLCRFADAVAFGDAAFLRVIADHGPFDLLCHHAAEAANYKSADFNALDALGANAKALPRVLKALEQSGCRRILLTGSVFEADEGAGTQPLRAFSPYGLSKSLTAAAFRYYALHEGMGLGKFVIANPFGPYEERRFTDHLVRCWVEGTRARVNTPDYVRDNIHVSLLAVAYADFASTLPDAGFVRFNPSYYIENQGAFAERFAREIGSRLGIATPLDYAIQSDFAEPMIRINTDRVAVDPARWTEKSAWDAVAEYYRGKFLTHTEPVGA